MPSLHHPKSRSHRHFAARVYLPINQTPIFPDCCIGCGEAKPLLTWTPEGNRSPFHGTASSYDNREMLPPIQIPICPNCIDLMPGHESPGTLTSPFSSKLALFLPAVFLAATVIFVAVHMQAVAVLTGLAGIIWFITATRAVWAQNHSALFDLRVGDDDTLIYYFRDPEYGREFNRLNDKSEQPKDSPL